MEPPLGRRLYLGHRAVHDVLDQRLQALGASLWNWVLLREATRASGVSQRELADLMHIEPPTLVRHLDRLEADGYVERRADPDDRRRLLVFVMPAGRKRLAELQKIAEHTDVELRALLDDHEIEVLGDTLMRIHEHFTTVAGEEGDRGRHH